MALPIISASQRLAEKQGVKLVLLGKSGIGKTTQLKTLPEDRTLFVDLEAGDLAVKDWHGDCVRPATWPEFRDLVVFLAGPNPALPADAPYSKAHFDHVCERYGDPAQLAKYDTYFVDSITVLARLALIWAKVQPQALSERTGKPDTRGAYGLLGQEMLTALTHLQHARGKHVVFVAILDEKLDDFNRKVFVPQIEGAKTAAELPGIVDEVVTLAEIKAEDGSSYRAFITQTLNPYGYPAKDRSGQPDLQEPPNLRALIDKCAAATRPSHPVFTSQTPKEHYMIRRAIDRGVSKERLARAFNVNLSSINRRINLLEGICPEAINLLQDKQFTPDVTRILRNMKAARQVEAVELMIASNTITVAHAEALLKATPPEQRSDVKPAEREKKTAPMEQIVKLEKEMNQVQEKYQEAEQHYGSDLLNLVVAKGYLTKLLANTAVKSYVARHEPEILSHLELVVNTVSMEEAVQQAEAAQLG